MIGNIKVICNMLNSKRLYLYHLLMKIAPPTKCNSLKVSVLRWCGASIGKDVCIFSSARFYGNFELTIGNNVFIGHEALIFGADGSKITLEDNCKVGSRAIIVTGMHKFEPFGECIRGEGTYANIIIKRGAVVSTGCIILPGIIIDKMSYVAPGAVCTKNVEPYTMVGGVPAKFIRNLND